MKYLDNIVREFFQQICFKLLSKRSKKCQMQFSFGHKTAAPGEARTHGLQIMRLTRCLLRYRGCKERLCKCWCERDLFKSLDIKKKRTCVGRESNPGQLLGRQLCSPLYHRRWVMIEVNKDFQFWRNATG